MAGNKITVRLFGRFLHAFLRAFVIVISLGALILLASDIKANTTVTATLTVANALPTASSVAITYGAGLTPPINLTSGTTTTVTAKFTVSDNNGCTDIDSGSPKTSAVFYRTDVAGGSSCTQNNANCYPMTCVEDAGSCSGGLTATYTCTAAVQPYADATDVGSPHASTNWTAYALPADNAGANAGGNATNTATVNSLTALGVTSSISYGSLALGADTGTADQITIVTNLGSRAIDTQVGAYGASSGDPYSMACTIGNIALVNEKYSTTASTAYVSKSPIVSNTAPTTIATNIPAGSSSTGNIYWGMSLPASGVGGSCAGHLVFTAVNH